MTTYRVTVELADVPAPERENQLVQALDDLGAMVSGPRGGGRQLVLTLAAESLLDATSAAVARLAAVPGLPETSGIRVARAGAEPGAGTHELVSVTEAAGLLGLTRQGVLRRIGMGVLPAHKVGATYTIPRSALPQR